MSLQTNKTNSEDFFQNILNAIPISIIVIDRGYNIVAMSGPAKASHSTSNNALMPSKCYQLSHHQNTPCEGDDHICPHKKVLETHEIVKVQHIHFDEHNNQQTVEITAIPILDKLDEVEYVIEIANDISKQVSVEAALQSVFIGTSTGVGTDFFRSLVANLASELNVKYALVGELTELRKIQTHAVWTGNGFTDNFTYDLENTPCQNVIETSICSYPEDIQILFPKDELLSEMNAVGYIGAPLTDSDGNTNGILAVLDTKPLKNEKLSEKLLSVFAARAGAELGRKISEKKQLDLEIKLNQAQKMESIGTLAGGIAHDFNNILSAIIGYSELSLPNVTEGTLLHGNIAKILDAGNRAKNLVQQILTFSRQSSPQVLTVNVKTIAVEVLKFIKATLPSYIEIQANYYGDPIVNADPSQIHQVIMNLCTNAGYAMEDQGGILKVTVANVDLDQEFAQKHPDIHPGTYAKISVSDTGGGILPENLSRIFEPYFTTKETGKGTGLGLALIHGIVQNHRGVIEVSSEVGKGSMFEIFLPSANVVETESIDYEKKLAGGNERIMIVDDEPDIIDVYQMMLEKAGYSVMAFTSSLEALETYKNNPDVFDLVITDQTMPKMAGDKLVAELQKITPEVLVVLCTGYTSRLLSQKLCINLGIGALLDKPISKKSLLQTVRSVLDGGYL